MERMRGSLNKPDDFLGEIDYLWRGTQGVVACALKNIRGRLVAR
jgi:hypothetical protein